MRVAHVVPNIDREATGPAYSVPALCDALARGGAEVSLHVLAPAPALDKAFRLVTHPQSEKRFGFSESMRKALAAEARVADVIHNHSLWMLPNVYPAWAVRGTKCRLVTSPRGTVSAWALSQRRWVKRAAYALLQGEVLERAHLLHATAESEANELRAMGLRAPIAIIPNGIDLPDGLGAARAERPAGARRRALFLSRLHPKKGIDDLLRVWRRLEPRFPEWELVIAGPDQDGWGTKMQALAHELGCERVAFPGALFGAAKVEAYRAADLFVLPTHSENFGMVVAEALAQGVPCVVSRGAPWEGLEGHGCGWWHDLGEGPLARALEEALALPAPELAAMGERGRAWMADFSWDRVGSMMRVAYEWLLNGGAVPDFVRVR